MKVYRSQAMNTSSSSEESTKKSEQQFIQTQNSTQTKWNKSNPPKPFGSYVLSKFENMHPCEFQRVPETYITSINKTQSIDLRMLQSQKLSSQQCSFSTKNNKGATSSWFESIQKANSTFQPFSQGLNIIPKRVPSSPNTRKHKAELAAEYKSFSMTVKDYRISPRVPKKQQVKGFRQPENNTFNANTHFLKRSGSRLLSDELNLLKLSLQRDSVPTQSTFSPKYQHIKTEMHSNRTHYDKQLSTERDNEDEEDEENENEKEDKSSEQSSNHAEQHISNLSVMYNTYRCKADYKKRDQLKEEHMQYQTRRNEHYKHLFHRNNFQTMRSDEQSPQSSYQKQSPWESSPQFNTTSPQFGNKFVLNKPFIKRNKNINIKKIVSPQQTQTSVISNESSSQGQNLPTLSLKIPISKLQSSPSSNPAKSSPLSLSGSPITNKSYFASHKRPFQDDYEKIQRLEDETEEKEQDLFIREKKQSSWKKPKEFHQNEIKTALVKQFLDEQTEIQEKFKIQIEVRSFEKKGIDSQINFKAPSSSVLELNKNIHKLPDNLNELNSPSSRNRMLQQTLSCFDQQNSPRSSTPKNSNNLREMKSKQKLKNFAATEESWQGSPRSQKKKAYQQHKYNGTFNLTFEFEQSNNNQGLNSQISNQKSSVFTPKKAALPPTININQVNQAEKEQNNENTNSPVKKQAISTKKSQFQSTQIEINNLSLQEKQLLLKIPLGIDSSNKQDISEVNQQQEQLLQVQRQNLEETLKIRRSSFNFSQPENSKRLSIQKAQQSAIPGILIEISDKKANNSNNNSMNNLSVINNQDQYLESPDNTRLTPRQTAFARKSVFKVKPPSMLFSEFFAENTKEKDNATQEGQNNNTLSKQSVDSSDSSEGEGQDGQRKNSRQSIKSLFLDGNMSRRENSIINNSGNSGKHRKNLDEKSPEKKNGGESPSKKKSNGWNSSSTGDQGGAFSDMLNGFLSKQEPEKIIAKNSFVRGQSEISEKKKGIASVPIDLKDIILPAIINKLQESIKLKELIEKNSQQLHSKECGDCQSLLNITKQFSRFLQFCFTSTGSWDWFTGMKVNPQIFEELVKLAGQAISQLNYEAQAVVYACEKLESEKRHFQQGLLIDELGGGSGLLSIISACLSELSVKLPQSFQALNPSEQTALLTRLLTFVADNNNNCNAPCASNNQNSQNSSNSSKFKPKETPSFLESFKDFSQTEFYSLKVMIWRAMMQKEYRPETVFRFLETLENSRYLIAQSMTIQLFLEDEQLYNSIIEELVWQIQCDGQLFIVFENNSELLTYFCQSLILTFFYKKPARFDLYFLVTKLKHLNLENLQAIEHLLTTILNYRQIPQNLLIDLPVKFKKLSYKSNLIQSPLSLLGGHSFIPVLIAEINQIMSSDECFENFLKKFPEDKRSLTLQNDEIAVQSGLRVLSFYLLSLMSQHDIYSTQDLSSSLQVFEVSITIPIQWKIAIEFALKNLKINEKTADLVLEAVQHQFSLLYINTQYASFNQVLLN